MHRIAVVGEKDTIYGFATLGFEIFSAKNSVEAKEIVRRLMNENFAIIYLSESIIADFFDELSALSANSLVSIVPIPGLAEKTNLGMENLRNTVIKAVGTDILFS